MGATGDALERVARVGVWDQQAATISEGTVSVAGELRAGGSVPGTKAPALMPQRRRSPRSRRRRPTRVRTRAAEARRHQPRRRARRAVAVRRKRPASISTTAAGWRGRRCGSARTPDDNAYAHPIYGLHAIVDLDTGEVHRGRGPRRAPIPAEEPGTSASRSWPTPRSRARARDHAAGRARASRSTAGRCGGRSGRCGSGSVRARGS